MQIGVHEVAVLFGADVDLELAREGLAGRSDVDRLTIELRSDLATSVLLETLLHEVLHHVWAQTALPELLPDQEEIVIRSLSPLLSTVVRFKDAPY